MEEYIMSNVVSLTDRIEAYKKALLEKRKADDLSDMLDASDQVLDSLENNFDMGVVIGIRNNQLQLSSTEDEIETVIGIVEDALDNLYQELNGE